MATATPTQLANVPLPAGATEVDDWADDARPRICSPVFQQTQRGRSNATTATTGSIGSDRRHPVPHGRVARLIGVDEATTQSYFDWEKSASPPREFVPQFITTDGWATSTQILVFGAALIAVGVVMDGAVGVAAGTFSAALLRRPGIQHWLKRVSAAIFGALALRLLLTDSR